ncbi:MULTISPECIES: response regulator [Virgibacillus]|uniref:Response regulator n=1 Tax=Virgibacillus dokdonensis TaxID=302167 RepID=A0A2K9J1I8_9BACI|nr:MULTISPECIES: response regulator [Virgibacillus]AUJ25822.1 Transcriptional regulatory protein DcuR [Virgibacillus dokdonensis]NWO13962.1 response regulator [Virgibacillus sp.]
MMKVMIVEDDPMVATINQQYIERSEGFHTIAAVGTITEVWEALTMDIPNLILLDVYLPGQTGLEFLQELRQKQYSIPVIMITAADDIGTIKTSLEYGVIDFLIKPFTYQRFKVAIDNFMQYHKLTTSMEKTDQETLDQLLIKEKTPISSRNNNVLTPLPKGLSKLTLKKVLQAIEKQTHAFSTEDIASSIDLSRISTRKYLQHLNDIGFLESELKYLSVGRPIMIYHVVPNKEHLIVDYK